MARDHLTAVAPSAPPPLRRAPNVAAAYADDVDRAGRFPAEAVAQLRSDGLLGLLVARGLGGGGGALKDAAAQAYGLARGCGASGMIYAMHSIQVACLVRHAQTSPWHLGLLEETAGEAVLFAGSTTDGASSGGLRDSSCALEPQASELALVKQAAVFSYAEHADAALVTARRDPSASPSEQVLVALRRADMALEPLRGWDAMGMRGTCSGGYLLSARCDPEQILPADFAEIHRMSMLPFSHLLWSAVWLGVAADAVDRGRRRARLARGGPGASAAHGLAEAAGRLHGLRAALAQAIDEVDSADAAQLSGFGAQARLNLIKVSMSRGALDAALLALEICGIEGYRNDSEFSVARHVRDLCSAPLMIPNRAILDSSARTAMMLDLNPGLDD